MNDAELRTLRKNAILAAQHCRRVPRMAFVADLIESLLLHVPSPEPEAPEPLELPCPRCNILHIDIGEWATPARLHKTHHCHHCHYEWRPKETPTIGVAPYDHRCQVCGEAHAGNPIGLHADEVAALEQALKPFADAWSKSGSLNGLDGGARMRLTAADFERAQRIYDEPVRKPERP